MSPKPGTRRLRILLLLLSVGLSAIFLLSDLSGGEVPQGPLGESVQDTDRYGLPSGRPFAGETVEVLLGEETGDFYYVKDSAVLSRNLFWETELLRKELGVELSVTVLPTDTEGERQALIDALTQSRNAGNPAYDLMTLDVELTVRAAAEELLCDLLEEDHFLPGASWEETLPRALLNDRLYLCFGAFDPSFVSSLLTTVTSRALLPQGGLSEDVLFEAVLDGDFTLERVMIYGEMIFGEENEGASLVLSYPQVLGLYLGTGGLVDTSMGGLRVDESIYRDATADFLEGVLAFSSGGELRLGADGAPLLSERRAAFVGMTFRSVGLMREREREDLLLLPFPKCDTLEADYRTPLSAGLFAWSIPSDSEQHACSAAILTVLFGNEDHRVSMMYEIFCGDAYGIDRERTEVFRLIVDSAVFDYGYAAPYLSGGGFYRMTSEYLSEGGGDGAFLRWKAYASEELHSELERWNDALREELLRTELR